MARLSVPVGTNGIVAIIFIDVSEAGVRHELERGLGRQSHRQEENQSPLGVIIR